MDEIKQLGELALGSRLKRLSDRFMQETARIYQSQRLGFEPSWFTVTSFLSKNGPASIQDISAALNVSHPAVIQVANQMTAKNLIETSKDPDDKRKRILKLSSEGIQLFESLRPVLENIEDSVKEIINTTGYDLLHVIERIESALEEKSLYERTAERIKSRMMDEIEIVRYSKKYKDYFRDLNYEWLQKYFEIEPEDVKILTDPEGTILNKGGGILFARYKNQIVGTCAAIKIDNTTYELAKMAVTEKFQGRQIGKKLALAVIGFAYSKGAARVTLETSRKLGPAVNLYTNLGFEYLKTDPSDSKYKRTTIKMKLDL